MDICSSVERSESSPAGTFAGGLAKTLSRASGFRKALALTAALLVLPGAAQAAFTITLNLSGNLTNSQRAVFNQAKATWESLIPGYQNGISLSGITISASSSDIDGVGGILGQAGPTNITNQGGFTLSTDGVMQFDSADLSNLEANGSLNSVILHEMAHVFGFGTLWNANGVYVNGTGLFTGANALAAYRSEFNQPTALGAPVDITSGGGTRDAHWRELGNVFDPQGRPLTNELMTGFLNTPTYISQMTLGSLRDIGFAPVPEPSTVAAMAAGLAGLAAARRRRAR